MSNRERPQDKEIERAYDQVWSLSPSRRPMPPPVDYRGREALGEDSVKKFVIPVAAASLVAFGASFVNPVATALPAAAVASKGQAIVRCPEASTTAIPIDPILTRSGESEHNHIFFGNENIVPMGESDIALYQQNHVASDFSNLTDANLEPPAAGETSCDDSQDGSAQWFPELFYNGAERTTRNTVGKPCKQQFACALYSRAYYETTDLTQAQTAHYIPDKLQMVNGFPEAIAPPSISDQASADSWMRRQQWSCGFHNGIQTPESPWPYSCALFYTNTGVEPDDGLVMLIHFPNCVSTDMASWDNFDGGPFYAPPGVSSINNNLTYSSGDTCPSGYALIPTISIRLHTLLEYQGTTREPIFNPSSTASELPSCYSSGLRGPCTNTAPQASDLLFGFASDAPGNGDGALCTIPVQSGCGWFTGHGDYMQMWQQAPVQSWPSSSPGDTLDTTASGGDTSAVAFNLDDIQEDCDFAPLPATKCGFVMVNLTSGT
jgi:hypothetical protein